MTILYVTGWEDGSNIGTNTSSVTSPKLSTSSRSLRATNPSVGAAAFETINAVAATGSANTDWNKANVYARFYFYCATAPGSGYEEIYSVYNGSGSLKMFCSINSSRQLGVYDRFGLHVATGTTALSLNTWYRIEVRSATGSSAAYEVRINGTTELSGTCDQSTSNSANALLGKGVNRNSNTIDYYFGPTKLDDSGFPGAGFISILLPTANGSTAQWTSGTNSSNYLEVDEVPADNDTTYIKCGTGGNQVHLVTLTDAAAAGVAGSIASIKAVAKIREDSSVTSSSGLRVRSGSTNTDTTGVNRTTTYTHARMILATDPNTGAAWTSSAIDALEIGVFETNAVSSRCTMLNVEVDWTPENHTSAIPLGSLTLTGKTPGATNTEVGSGHTSAIPVGSLSISGLVPSATKTERHFSSVPGGSLTLTGRAPGAATTEKHIAALPGGVLTITGNAPGATTTEKHFVSIPKGEISTSAKTPSATVTERNYSAIPLGSLVLTARTPGATATDINPHTVALPLGALVLTGRVPSATISEPAGGTIVLVNSNRTELRVSHGANRKTVTREASVDHRLQQRVTIGRDRIVGSRRSRRR